MAIEVICKGCARKLRVGDENAGKLARCPSCGETFTVPMGRGAISPDFSAPAPTQTYGAAPVDRWYLKTEDGITYGPAEKAELDSWVAEGRVTAGSQLLREGETAWQPAYRLYPALGLGSGSPPAPAPGPVRNPYAEQPQASNPYASPAGTGAEILGTGTIGGRYVQPHRGGLILTMGILGLCLCGFLGIAAVVMAQEDLKLIAAGRMDASGKGMTTAGLILGIISIVLMVLGTLVSVVGNIR